MAQEKPKQLEILTAPNYNSLVGKINSMKLQKEDILKISPMEEGICLLYYVTA